MAGLALALATAVAALAAFAAAPAATAGFSGEKAKHWTRQIASVGPRPAGSVRERRAGRIAARRLEALGYDVGIQTFTLPNGRISRNVVARTPGTLRVIIVAHMDGVRGTQAANDNASGVGTLLELARNLRGEEGVRLAALGAEERMVTGSPYHLGSLRFTRSLRDSVKEGVRLALSVDMVGVGTTFHVRGLEASPNRSARILLRRARALGVPVTYLRDTGQSDHDDLTRGGVPAAWVEWRWDRCWHQPCDRIRRVKPRKLRRAGRVVLAASRHVLDRF
ncbi:MAG TPA: M28 family peptidase [Gaiellaceae bacterium]|nr:M28 family peptidase [Gaiellaceae bacterium]